jgi:SAM-dependent methyltransferase
MKNEVAWRPTKFIKTPHGLRASQDTREVGISSRLSIEVVAPYYEQMLMRHARGNLLDLGSGHAPLYGVYRMLVDSVTCVDWAASLHPSPFPDFLVNLNEPLPLTDATYDTLVLTDVIEHIDRPEILWPEMARILAPGGRLLLATPFIYWIHEAPHDYARYTEHMLRRFCERHGFEVLELNTIGGSPEVLFDILGRHLARWQLLSRIHFAIARMILSTSPVRRLSKLSGRWFPLAYTLVARRM